MPPVSVDRASMLKVAKNLGQAGKPLPPEMANDPAYLAAHDQGSADGDRGAQFHPPAPKRAPAKKKFAPKPPADDQWSDATTTESQSLQRRNRATAAAVNAPRQGFALANAFTPATLGGDGGGLLLALVLYPLVIATIQHGAAGPGLWFRAKWLNETTAAPANLPLPQAQTTNPNAPYYRNPSATPGQPGSGQFPNGDPIPGYPQVPDPNAPHAS